MKKAFIKFLVRYILPLFMEFFREAILEGLRHAFANWKEKRRKKHEEAEASAETEEEKERVRKEKKEEEERLDEMQETFIKSFQESFQRGMVDFNNKLKIEERNMSNNDVKDLN